MTDSNAYSPSTIEEWEAKLMDAWRIADSLSIQEPELIFPHRKTVREIIEKLEQSLQTAAKEESNGRKE